MKRMLQVLAASAMAAVALSAWSPAQESLGDAARAARMSRRAAAPGEKVYTNDNLPTASGLGIASVGSPTAATSGNNAAATSNSAAPSAAASGDQSQLRSVAPEDSPEARQKIYNAWKSRIDDQKNEISQLQRELNVVQREGQISAAVFYADAGSQLRDPKRYADEQRARQAEMTSKQQALATAQQKLADLEEQARKAGVPAGQR